MSQKISSGLIAVTFTAALMLASAAQAGPLTAGTAGPEASPWSLAWAWLTEVWGDLTGLHDATAPGSFEMNGITEGGPCSGECTSGDPDHGWGIDPNGTGG